MNLSVPRGSSHDRVKGLLFDQRAVGAPSPLAARRRLAPVSCRHPAETTALLAS
jgi:hypothetical protein